MNTDFTSRSPNVPLEKGQEAGSRRQGRQRQCLPNPRGPGGRAGDGQFPVNTGRVSVFREFVFQVKNTKSWLKHSSRVTQRAMLWGKRKEAEETEWRGRTWRSRGSWRLIRGRVVFADPNPRSTHLSSSEGRRHAGSQTPNAATGAAAGRWLWLSSSATVKKLELTSLSLEEMMAI